MIKTVNLTREFNGTVAVDRLSLEIGKGEVFGFLGPNGAGKTTTVRMLTGLIRPTRGSARVMDYEIGTDDIHIRRNVGILTESPGMYDRLSALRNLSIYAELYEVEHVEKQVEKYLRMLGLWERRLEATGTFSKGMRQKLALARSLLHEPSVLFLDEPTAGLDPEASKLVRDFIRELKGEGRTIFLCTHNLDEADKLCDRIAVFKTTLRVVERPSALRQQLYGRQTVFHLVDRAQQAKLFVEQLPGVKSATVVDQRLLIATEDPDQENPKLIRALVNANFEIRFVGELRHSLEDVYLQLIGQAD